ncbi:hypothetical protein J1786_05700 [Rahnella sp. L72c]|uniref:Uncharacterized protein n=1 Tax=Rahnella perminowiae TaxID=2816244 RepID=A0ABS6KXM1_9GAMM|nr:hypothetical protein [Rahnella perminowiae]MBU9834323.1 hypothetical protein [Rahnella perminowiae]
MEPFETGLGKFWFLSCTERLIEKLSVSYVRCSLNALRRNRPREKSAFPSWVSLRFFNKRFRSLAMFQVSPGSKIPPEGKVENRASVCEGCNPNEGHRAAAGFCGYHTPI